MFEAFATCSLCSTLPTVGAPPSPRTKHWFSSKQLKLQSPKPPETTNALLSVTISSWAREALGALLCLLDLQGSEARLFALSGCVADMGFRVYVGPRVRV